MNNEIRRKITSLMLATVMVAGGMTFAIPGAIPDAYAAGRLTVSAEDNGNFAGVQVIEIVVNDPQRSDLNNEGIPNVEINNDKVEMIQANNGLWYAYVANDNAITAYDDAMDSVNLYGVDRTLDHDLESVGIYKKAVGFLDGFNSIDRSFNNGKNSEAKDHWPLIQTYNISDDSEVIITYGTGNNADRVTIDYDYDDTKDITLDREQYPKNSYVHIALDDSLLNLSPTNDDVWTFFADSDTVKYGDTTVNWSLLGFENGPLAFSDDDIFNFMNTTISSSFDENDTVKSITLRESNSNDDMFVNYNTSYESGLLVVEDGSSSSISYDSAHSVLYDTFNGIVSFDSQVTEWLSGISLELSVIDGDRNLNSKNTESISATEVMSEVPYIKIGNPITIDTLYDDGSMNKIYGMDGDVMTDITTTEDSRTASHTMKLSIPTNTDKIFVNATIPTDYYEHISHPHIFPYINYDFTSFGGGSGTYYTGHIDGTDSDLPSGVIQNSNSTHLNFAIPVNMSDDDANVSMEGQSYFDILFFGQIGHAADDVGDLEDNVTRVNDAIYRFELEETDDNTANFTGTVEYIMINQISVFDKETYDGIATTDSDVIIIVNDDMSGTDSVTVSYIDLDTTNNPDTLSVKKPANTHSGIITVDSDSYSSGNTVTVTLTDSDLNTDSETIQVYRVDDKRNWVGNESVWLSQLKINDQIYNGQCNDGKLLAFNATGFTLQETSDSSGIFTGSFRLPLNYCDSNGDVVTTNGLNLDLEYQDYSDSSGRPNQTQDSANIKSNTGSVTLERSVYPVPFEGAEFPLHSNKGGNLPDGPVTIVVQVTDPDFNVSSSGSDTISKDKITLKVSRGSSFYDMTHLLSSDLEETTPQSGVFETEILLRQGDYPNDNTPTVPTDKFGNIEQGDILSVVYTDPNDASGDKNTVTDSATFDLRNAVLSTNIGSYLIGSDAIITLMEPDLNLDSGSVETWDLGLVSWDSDAGTVTLDNSIFDAVPAGLRETGENTGIFQVNISIPRDIGGTVLERGEEIELEYTDYGPAGANFVGDDNEDITETIFTSDFGSSISLDKEVYSWTDKVYISVLAPDYNFDRNAIDEIGGEDSKIRIASRAGELDEYKLVETGPNTNTFSGEVILTGFSTHDADGDGVEGDASGTTTSRDGAGPRDGILATTNNGGITVSFELSDGEVISQSALIKWNTAEVKWMEESYPASASGQIMVSDPDMNLNPESVDSFNVNVWSDTVSGGIQLRVTETEKTSGIFEGSVSFAIGSGSSGSRLAVSEGDTVTVEYVDRTVPDSRSVSDELRISATTLIGTIVPPLERAPVENLRIVNSIGTTLTSVSVDQQIVLQADLNSGQDKVQPFAYLVQIQDESGVTVSLSWLADGLLNPGQSMSPSQSWTPTMSGTYKVTAFVWISVSDPVALSSPISIDIVVT